MSDTESPLLFCNKPMKEEKYTKYLGDWLSTNGLADSVRITVNKRFGLVQRTIADIRLIVDDLPDAEHYRLMADSFACRRS